MVVRRDRCYGRPGYGGCHCRAVCDYPRQSATGWDDVDGLSSGTCRYERDPLAIRRPRRLIIPTGESQPPHVDQSEIGIVCKVDRALTIAVRHKCNLLAVGRPRRLLVVELVLAQIRRLA